MYIAENIRFINDKIRNFKKILNFLIDPLIEFATDP